MSERRQKTNRVGSKRRRSEVNRLGSRLLDEFDTVRLFEGNPPLPLELEDLGYELDELQDHMAGQIWSDDLQGAVRRAWAVDQAKRGAAMASELGLERTAKVAGSIATLLVGFQGDSDSTA